MAAPPCDGDDECEPEQQAARLLGEEDSKEAPSGGLETSIRGRFLLPALLVGSALAATTAVAVSERRRSLRRIAAEALVEASQKDGDFPSLCGKMEEDTEYVVDGEGSWGINFDHIPTAEMCCAMCQGEPKCEAFTWVKDAGLDGCPSQCWLKGDTGTSQKKEGLISGVPPQRLAVPDIPKGEGSGSSSLYCTSLMVPRGYEEGMLLWQYKHKASIFACNAADIYSNESIELAPDVVTKKINSTLKCEYGGDSGTALNAWIFIEYWRVVIEDKTYADHGWTVKVDADAVFFPDRLLKVVKDHTADAYINNCKYGMHGPIEVIGKGALDKLAADYKESFDGKAPKQCVEKQDFGLWGEDMFLDQCLHTVLEVGTSPVDERLMCEDHCDCPAWYWCQNGTDRVSFHPFKTIFSYKNCMANSMGGELLPAGAEEEEEELPVAKPASGSSPSPSSSSSSSSGSRGPASTPATPAPAPPPPPTPLPDEIISPHPTMSQAEFYAEGEDSGKDDSSDEDDSSEEVSSGGSSSSCADACDSPYSSKRSCQCNEQCQEYNSCCLDYAELCEGGATATIDERSTVGSGDEGSSIGVGSSSSSSSSAEDSCEADGCHVPYSPSRSCQCNGKCAEFGNCCVDYHDSCA